MAEVKYSSIYDPNYIGVFMFYHVFTFCFQKHFVDSHVNLWFLLTYVDYYR